MPFTPLLRGDAVITNYRRNCLMIMCSKCKKRPAVVFITSVQGSEKKNEGLCLSCARAQNIPQIKEYMDKLGITDEELDQLSDQMMGMLDGDSFEMGGSGVLPDFITNMFGGNDSDGDEGEKSGFDPRNLFGGKSSDDEKFSDNKEKKIFRAEIAGAVRHDANLHMIDLHGFIPAPAGAHARRRQWHPTTRSARPWIR